MQFISVRLTWLVVATVENSAHIISLREWQESFLIGREYKNFSRYLSALVKHKSFWSLAVWLIFQQTTAMRQNCLCFHQYIFKDHSCISLWNTVFEPNLM